MKWAKVEDIKSKVELLEMEGEITSEAAIIMNEIAESCVTNDGVGTWEWMEVRKNSTSVMYVQCNKCHRTNRTRMSNYCPFCGIPMKKGELNDKPTKA